jgi:2-polyprenyl-6-methoxyphenol hydroxylase-like FAD-dependent oxidoreductase
MSDKTIAIIGAGIGGVAAGVALHQAGFSVKVFERADRLREAGAGMSLWPNGTAVLQQLGLLEAVAAQGQSGRRFLVRSRTGNVLMKIGTDRAETPTICIHRAHLLKILADALPPECLAPAHEVADLKFTGKKVNLGFTNGQRTVCDGVVGADGLHSTMRGRLASISKPAYHGYAIFRGIADLPENFSVEDNSESWEAGSRFGILSVGGNKVCWYATVNSSNPPVAADWPKERLQEKFRDWHSPIPELIAITDPSVIMVNAARDQQPLRHWNQGPATLMGDASHALTPNLGQGACMAMEDALVLANCLKQRTDVSDGFRLYESMRFHRIRSAIWRSRWLGTVGQLENRLIVSLRNAITKALPGRLFECHSSFDQFMTILGGEALQATLPSRLSSAKWMPHGWPG